MKRWLRPALAGMGMLLLGILVPAMHAVAADGDTLRLDRARGTLSCGVSEGITGFSARDASGAWSGIDVDFCRAVAAAALGDANKVRFLPLIATARFPALISREIDLLARNTTWTVEREAVFSVRFVGVLYFDSQGFLVRADGPYAHGGSLDGATICVERGTNQADDLRAFAASKGWHFKPLDEVNIDALHKAFESGACPVLTDDASALAELLLHVPDRSAYVIRDERISKEPLGPAVRWGDGQWTTLVRAVYAALIDAEERGLKADDAQAIITGKKDAAAQEYLAETRHIGRALGIAPDWAVRAVAAVGNYGEIFERNLGQGSALKLDRGVNRPWTEGGLLYAPPFQ